MFCVIILNHSTPKTNLLLIIYHNNNYKLIYVKMYDENIININYLNIVVKINYCSGGIIWSNESL